MAQAASTVRVSASGERSDVLALPRRAPKYTVMPRPLSRLYSTVSTSPRRTVTDWPTAAETSTSASLAPFSRATSRHLRATSAMASRESGRDAEAIGWSGMGISPREAGSAGAVKSAPRTTLTAEEWKTTSLSARPAESGR